MTSNNSQNNSINFVELFHEYKSKWYYFAISIFIFLVIGVAYALIKKPVYNVHASVLISTEDQSGGANQMMKQFNMGDMFGGNSTVDDELAVMASHAVLRSTVEELGLNISYNVRTNFFRRNFKYKDEPVKLICEKSLQDTLRSSLYFKLNIDDSQRVSIEAKANGKFLAETEDQTFPVTLKTVYGTFIFNKTKHFDKFFEKEEAFKEYITLGGYDAVAEDLNQLLSISIPNKKANVIALDYQTTHIGYGKEIINTVITNYNKKGIENKRIKDEKTANFISNRLETLVNELDASEELIEEYKRSHNISNLGAEASYQFGRKTSLETKLINAETEFEILQMTRDFISNPVNKYSMIPYSAGDGAATGIIAAYNSLIAERIKLENNAKANNIALQALTKQIDALRENITETLNKSYETSLVRLNELRKQMHESQAKLGEIPSQEREYLSMKRHQSVKEQLYLYLLQQQEETTLNIANAMARGIIVDNAYAFNAPVSASKKKIVFIFFFLGLITPIAYFYARNLLRNKFDTKEELEKRTSIPILGEICTSKRNNILVVKEGGSTSAAELFRLVRSNLQFILNNQAEKVIMVTSTIAGEGKSFISINLASSFALLGKKVCLIGMDIRKPQLANYLNLPASIGLTQYLASDQYKIDDITLKAPVAENMDIIQAGPIPPNPAELLMTEKVDQLFLELRQHYDYIIIDSAPVGMVSDSLTLSRVTDATVYVCRANHTTFSEIKFFNNLYTGNRLKKMAIVVNGTKTTHGYGYGYS